MSVKKTSTLVREQSPCWILANGRWETGEIGVDRLLHYANVACVPIFVAVGYGWDSAVEMNRREHRQKSGGARM